MPALTTWWRLDVTELAPHAHSDAVAAVGADLERRLAEEHRSYHTTQHLVEMFWALEELEQAGAISSREAVVARLAAWFHDAVYDPTSAAGDNEVASAELAVRDLTALGLNRTDVDTIGELVLATEKHRLPRHGLAAAFHDADLWILSAPPERYLDYTTEVREEYAAVPDAAFRAGRAAILRPFLDRESVYATAVAREQWEDRARVNVAGELSDLDAAQLR